MGIVLNKRWNVTLKMLRDQTCPNTETWKDAKTNTSYMRRCLPRSHNSYEITSREAEEDIWKTDEDALLVTIKARHNKER